MYDNYKIIKEICDEMGNHLSLRYIEVLGPKRLILPSLSDDDSRYYEFHSLAWDVKSGSAWKRKVTISRDDMLQDGHTRWISNIHSLDSLYGSSIIQVAEGDWDISYSWRQWDLFSNKEIRTIQVCESPFSKLRDSDN